MSDSTATEALPAAAALTKNALEALERHFGHRAFLDGQESVVSSLLAGRDALAIMPTGGGKSLCYQLPALCRDGVTIVVSPLIALMQDQVQALQRRGIAATLINSTVSWTEQRDRLRDLRDGRFKLVYVAPERFRNEAFLAALKEVEIALFAVDEAHCLSQWGHDFRPDYLRLGQALDRIGRPQTAAFTATATPEVRDDILKHLQLRDPFVSVRGFSRPNLSLNVTPCRTHAEKYDRLFHVIREYRTGIVYCATRRRVEEVYETLRAERIPASFYHAGLDDAGRSKAQEQFITRKSDVVVATNAFGMGIDRADVRFVCHFELPGSVEAFYQEAGRAGRDGEPSWCELFYNYADTRTQEFFIEGSNPDVVTIRNIYQLLLNGQNESHEAVAPLKALAEAMGLKNDMAVSSAMSALARAGYIQRFDIPGERMRGTRLLKPDVRARDLELDETGLTEKARRDWARLDSMIQFCDSSLCRQRVILEYFGEPDAGECGTCDNCRRSGAARTLREATPEELTIVRKALSGVARMSQKSGNGWMGRFGRQKIIQMLVGSHSQDVLAARLDELSTYGILADVGTGYLNVLFREFSAGGLIHTTSGEYPLVTLSAKGERVMFGRESCSLRWPQTAKGDPAAAAEKAKAKSAKETPALQELGFDQALFDRLKAVRLALAKRDGVPAFAVFTNATLEFFTRLRPTSAAQALRIRGVSESKATKYLAPFLEEIGRPG